MRSAASVSPTRASSSRPRASRSALGSPCRSSAGACARARQVGVERGLLQRGADRAADLGALVHDVQASHARAAGGRRQQRGEHQHRRRLARAVGPEETVDLARRDLEVDAVDGAHAALEVADQALDLDSVAVSAMVHDLSERPRCNRPAQLRRRLSGETRTAATL